MRGNDLSDDGDVWPATISRSIAMTDEGIVCGAGSILARMTDHGGARRLALDADRERLLALLSVAHGRPVGADTLLHIEAAASHWRRGDKALANLRLVFAGLPNLAAPADAYRMRLAEYLLDEGMAPDALMTELGFGPAAIDLVKYAPDEPRVPAGNGRRSGEWDFGGRVPAFGAGNDRIVVAMEGDPADAKEDLEEPGPHHGQTKPYEEQPGAAFDPLPGLPAPSGLPTVSGGTPGTASIPTGQLPAGVGPGPFAVQAIPAGPNPRPTPSQRAQINAIGQQYGCHNCGTTDPGSPSGFYCDHQFPTALNQPGAQQVYLPHCFRCSCSQGGQITHYKQQNQ